MCGDGVVGFGGQLDIARGLGEIIRLSAFSVVRDSHGKTITVAAKNNGTPDPGA